MPFYGAQPTAAADVAKIKALINAPSMAWPRRGHRTRPLAGVFDQALTAAGVAQEGHVYANANHGFHNDTTPRYDEAAAKEAWQHTLDWFNKYVKA